MMSTLLEASGNGDSPLESRQGLTSTKEDLKPPPPHPERVPSHCEKHQLQSGIGFDLGLGGRCLPQAIG